MHEMSTVFPSSNSNLGIQSLARELSAITVSVFRPPPPPAEYLPHGDGHTVLVLPGFLAGDWTTARLRSVITQLGYRVATPKVLFNTGPTIPMLVRFKRKLLNLADTSKAPVSVVGVSLGGVLARQLALDNAESVRCVVTLCSPVRYPVITPLQPLAAVLTPLHESAWLDRRKEIGGPLPVPVTAIYSEDDGIVDWRQCLQIEGPNATNIRVGGAHMTIGSNPEVHAVVAQALARRIS
jgi:pimeloyl-ACP methyl ester carboxylesterase